MSGICGILRLDGGPVAAEDIDGLTGALEHRGPDGSSAWRSGEVALGHSLLATTPEALTERLPLTEAESGCTITADVRLDNREELIEALGLGSERRVIGDGELILRSYLRWAEACPKHLLGDFAFAIWDPREQRLFCARDHMGMRRFNYHHRPGGIFVFATEEDAVLEQRDVAREVNEARVADFIERMEGADFTSTFFDDLFRLPPAHSLTVSVHGLELRRYWQLRLGPELKLASADQYVGAFRDVFTEAVRCRLRSAGPVGCLLSGGLDSNSVAAVAARLLGERNGGKLKTFSAASDDPAGCRETQFIRRALANPGFAPAVVSHGSLGTLREDLARWLEAVSNPFDAHMSMARALYSIARREGVRVMLDGAGSDLILASGNRVAQLLRQGRFRQALIEARGDARFWRERRPEMVLLAAGWAALVPRPVRAARHWLASLIGTWSRRRAADGLARRVRLTRRAQRYRRLIGTYQPADRAYRVAQIGHPHTAAGRERYDRVASAFAIEPRDPFLDVRVVEFCLALPAAELKSGGFPKLVLRRAMKGLVPDVILDRRGKEHVGLDFTRQLVRGSAGWPGRWAALVPRLRRFVSPKLLDREPPFLPDSEPAGPGTMDLDTFIELLALGCWLEHNDVPRV